MIFVATHYTAEAERQAPGHEIYFKTGTGTIAFKTGDEYHAWKRHMRLIASQGPTQHDKQPEPPIPTFQR